MKKIKISLIDNDQIVLAKTDLNDSKNHSLSSFIKRIKEELVTGETALIEIEEQNKNSLRFEITQAV